MKTEFSRFLDTLERAPKTIDAYRNALEQFAKVVGENAELNTETYISFLIYLRRKAPSTQTVYTTAVRKFFAFSKAGNLAELKTVTEKYTTKAARRVVKFNREAVEQIITYCRSLKENPSNSTGANLEALRDRAFVLTLADTGLRISEACALINHFPPNRYLPAMTYVPVKPSARLQLVVCGRQSKIAWQRLAWSVMPSGFTISAIIL